MMNRRYIHLAFTFLFLLGLAACSSSAPDNAASGDGDVLPAGDQANAGTDAVPADAPAANGDLPPAVDQAATDPNAAPATLDAPANVPTDPNAAQAQAAPTDPAATTTTASNSTTSSSTETTGAIPPAPAPEAAQPTAEPEHVATRAHHGGGSGQFDSYTVQAGDTLMKIAFETYGDLYRWHDLYEANRDKISSPNAIPAGTVLKVERPSEPVSIARNGEKYLIKLGDTLGTISQDVYGTNKKWRKIYENNRELIKDPNRIFAGFYLYYTIDEEDRKELAPKPMAQNDNGTSGSAGGGLSTMGTTTASAPAPDTNRMPASATTAPAPAQAQAPAQPAAAAAAANAPAAIPPMPSAPQGGQNTSAVAPTVPSGT